MVFIVITIIIELLLIVYLFYLRRKDKRRMAELEHFIWSKLDEEDDSEDLNHKNNSSLN